MRIIAMNMLTANTTAANGRSERLVSVTHQPIFQFLSSSNERSIWRSARSNCSRWEATGLRSWAPCRWASSSALRMR